MKNRFLAILVVLLAFCGAAKADVTFSLSDTYLYFGEIEVGAGSITQSVTIQNISDEAQASGTVWTYTLEYPEQTEHFTVNRVGDRLDIIFEPKDVISGANLYVRATAESGETSYQTVWCDATGFKYDNTMDLSLYLPTDFGPYSAGEYPLDAILEAMGGTLVLPWYYLPADLKGEFHINVGSNLISTTVSSSNKNVFAKMYMSSISLGGATRKTFYIQSVPDALGVYSSTITVESVVDKGIHADEIIRKSFDIDIIFYYLSLDLCWIDRTSNSVTVQWNTNPYADSYFIQLDDQSATYTNDDAVDGKLTHTFDGLNAGVTYLVDLTTTVPDQNGGSDVYENVERLSVHTVDEVFNMLGSIPYDFPWPSIPFSYNGYSLNIDMSDIDLSNAFDENHKALMDSLYVITNKFPTYLQSGSSSSMLLVFGKRSDNYYSLVDAANLPEYGHRVLRNLDGKRLYFRGTCDNLGTGIGNEGFDIDGFFTLEGRGTSIAGAKGNNVDIYLDDYRISTENKNINLGSDATATLFQQLMGGKVDIGRAAPFTIKSRGEYNGGQEYTVHFHLIGDNRLSTGSKTVLSAPSGNFTQKLMGMFLEILDISAAGIYVSPDATTSSNLFNSSILINLSPQLIFEHAIWVATSSRICCD